MVIRITFINIFTHYFVAKEIVIISNHSLLIDFIIISLTLEIPLKLRIFCFI